MASDQSRVAQLPPGYREEYNGEGIVAVATVFIAIEVVGIVLRFWARRIGKIAWGADDVLIIPGAIFCLGVIACGLGDLRYGGVGYHAAVVAPSKLITWLKFTLIIPMVYLPAVIFPKLSILVLYLRIFTKQTDRIACWAIGGFMIANCVGTMVAGCFICRPLEFLWDRTIPGGHCININAWYRWSSLMNILTDVTMLVLPLPVIWKIQTTKKVKIGLTITFTTGSIGLITSIIRFAGFFTEDFSKDGTWTAGKLIILSIVESGIYLIAACLPTYRPLALLLWRKMPPFSLHSGSGTRPSTIRPETYEVPLKPHRKNGFSRLDKNKNPMVPPQDSEEVKPGEMV